MLSPLRLVTISRDGRPNRNIVKFGEILTILGATAVLFSKLEEDMQTFGYFVYIGLIYVLWTCEDLCMSLTTGLTTGVVGAATEHWCALRLFPKLLPMPH